MPFALLSVSNKSNIDILASALLSAGFSLLASGSTAAFLRGQGLPVTDVAEYTQSPEILGGRVKTLHPAIHGGILARDDNSEDLKTLAALEWDLINVVVVNLYPFQDTIAQKNTSLDEAIEQIDIGGVALIRAAAKNFARVAVVTDPNDYGRIVDALHDSAEIPLELRRSLAEKAFIHTSQYDQAIAAYLTPETPLTLTLYPQTTELRYGENPHQAGKLYTTIPNAGPLGGYLIQGKALSYNNLLDCDAAFRAAQSFKEPTAVIVKHLSPCGVASAGNIHTAFREALACDPISAFGGIIAFNDTVDAALVDSFRELFIECLIAPNVSEDARTLLAKRPNCRVIQAPLAAQTTEEWRSIEGGLLWQSRDKGDPLDSEWRVVTKRQPSMEEMRAMIFAWKVSMHVKSNAIVLAQHEHTVGIGGGQTNRLDSVRQAVERAGELTQGAALASDAFFPFPDALEIAIKSGVSAVIQPGGAKRDETVIETADAAGITMIFTGTRHFRH